MFPSLPVSILYGTVITTLFDDVFRFALIMEQLVLKSKELIFTVPMLSPFSSQIPALYHGLLFSLHSCTPLRNGSSCCTLNIFSHMLVIVWADGLNHSICTLPSGYFNNCVQFYILLLIIFYCLYFVKTPSPHLGCQRLLPGLLGPQFFLPMLILVH